MEAQRIVSLVPSLTKTLYDLGLGPSIVGITKFCVDPPQLHKTSTLVGGTKDPDLETIRRLKPTHIVVNEEENTPQDIERCKDIASTVTTFPKSPHDVPDMLEIIGTTFRCEDKAKGFADVVRNQLASLEACSKREQRFLYFIWREPYMIVGRDTYINRYLNLIGLENYDASVDRYPTIDTTSLETIPEDVWILLSTEPYPFRRRDAKRLGAIWTGKRNIWKVDGKLASWYGSLTVEALTALQQFSTGEESPLFKRF